MSQCYQCGNDFRSLFDGDDYCSNECAEESLRERKRIEADRIWAAESAACERMANLMGFDAEELQ